jgi:AcrR family transcriptional regulator
MATPAYDHDDGPFALRVDYSSAPILARLPRGRHGLPQDFIDRNHRNRLLSGAIEAISERGYGAMTVTDITTHAAVSRNAFYRHFAGKEECFLATYDVVVEWLFAAVEEALEPGGGWSQKVTAAVATTLDLFAADPRLARLCAVEAPLAGRASVARHEALIERLAALLRGGRDEGPLGPELPPRLEEALLGGAVALIARFVHAGRAGELQELAPELSELLLAPYLGPDEARRLVATAA